jgi:precorrin-2 dehydrogenase/sirohydrochlorin ferrochelatase
VGERKIKTLLHYGACVNLIAQDLTPWLEIQHREERLTLLGDTYEESCLDHVDFVFASTSDKVLNRKIATDAHRKGIWCNMATDPEMGSVIIPAVMQRGRLTIAVSTSGSSPAIAAKIRNALEEQFGPEWSVTLRLLNGIRLAIQDKGLGSAQNQELFRKIADLSLPRWIARQERQEALDALCDTCHPWLELEELNQLWDEAWEPSSSSLPHCATVSGPLDI